MKVPLLLKRLRPRYLRAWMDGCSIHPTTRIRPKAMILSKPRNSIRIGARTKIHPFALVTSHGGSITIGSNCSVNSFAVLNGQGGLTIGDDVRIAPHAVVMSGNHNFDRLDVPIRSQGSTRKGIVIEDDVWLGAHCVVLDGVTIARGCVIAAGAIVSKSTEPYGAYVGVPARRLRDRGEREPAPPNRERHARLRAPGEPARRKSAHG